MKLRNTICYVLMLSILSLNGRTLYAGRDSIGAGALAGAGAGGEPGAGSRAEIGIESLIAQSRESESYSDEKCESIITQVNNYYAKQAEGSCRENTMIEKFASVTVSATGMISLYFLGADLVNSWVKDDKIGYIMGPLFEIPIACLAYQAQNDFIKGAKQTIDPEWNNLSRSLLSLKRIGKGTYLLAMGCLGGAMATTAVYYTDYYLKPLIGSTVWFFIPPAAVSNTLMASLATMGLLKFFKDTANEYLFKRCSSDEICEREELKKWVQHFTQVIKDDISSGKTQVALDRLQLIKQGKLNEVLKSAREDSLVLDSGESASKVTPVRSRTYRIGQAISGVAGGITGLIGSYAMIEGTRMASYYILNSWCGIDAEIAQNIAYVCGYLGGTTMGFYRGFSAKWSFQRIHDLIYSCKTSNPSCSLKAAASEILNWVLGFVAVAPRIQIVLDNVSRGPGQYIVMASNIVATTCNDYFGWKKVPDVVKDLCGSKSDDQKLLQLLNNLSDDLGYMSDETIHVLYQDVVKNREEI